ncbi:Putative conjugal transfer protein TraK [Pectobacterium atrosepticum ICMP 1526]|uniref:type IV secretory system conjugative DNA transfer family protein n=1 Tax=Pectobacterium atrosepticum TaxID=29471 RepID=UPI000507946A|nr:type IV secretory system conjugative DNA transfer family protein [Pectobacterium atrosepticum]KFX10708.1 conjugal transfer protein TraK [Pectobacterium atrosepticum]KMK87264.1 Putative conjugal transfer protein TraK [Pectobacterium atrosepticum ICMP 1526]
MQLRKSISRTDVISTVIFSIVFLCIGGAIGLYAGGLVFLSLTHISSQLLNYDTLIQAWDYWHVKKMQAPIIVGTIIFLLASIVPFIGVIITAFFESLPPNIHGDATVITDKELEDSGLLSTDESDKPEILIGKVAEGIYKGRYLKFSGQQFLGLGAPTRSGKGVGFVIPNLLNYRDSVCVLDIKAENFIMTAGYREKQGQEIYVFAPDGYRFTKEDYIKYKLSDHYVNMTKEEQKEFEERYYDNAQVLTHRWNPLGYISRSKSRRVGDIKDMVAIIYPDSGGDNSIWNSMASGVFSAYILYMLDMESIVNRINAEIRDNRINNIYDDREELKPYPVTMAQMFSLTGVGNLAEWMNEEILYWKDQGYPLSIECTEGFNRFISVDEKTRGNIMQNFSQPLSIFEAESCRLATEDNDFNFDDLRKKRMSVYIVLSPSGIKKYKRLVNLFFSQLITINTRVLPEHDDSIKYQCLLALDEFTSMGKVDIIESSIAFTAGYDLRYMIIYQNDGQLESEDAYGKAGAATLKENLAVEVIYPPKTVNQTAERVSKTFGKKTITVKTKSRTNSNGGVSTGTNESYVGRDLYLPQEVVALGSEKYVMRNIGKGKKTKVAINQIIIMEQVKAFVAHKIIYFDEPVFLERKKIATDNIPSIPVLKAIERYDIPRSKRTDVPERI